MPVTEMEKEKVGKGCGAVRTYSKGTHGMLGKGEIMREFPPEIFDPLGAWQGKNVKRDGVLDENLDRTPDQKLLK